MGLATLAVAAVRVLLQHEITVDENQYAHAAWLVAKGFIPFREFFEFHLPLLYQLGAPTFLIAGDDPAAIVPLQLTMLLWIVLSGLAVAALGRGRGFAVALGPLLLLACPDWLKFATQFRPDVCASALFLCSIAVLARSESPPWRRSLACGAALALAAWGSQKALLYGAASLAPILVASWVQRDRKAPREFSTGAFLGGGAAVGAIVLTYLVSTNSLQDCWKWCFVWVMEQSSRAVGFRVWQYLPEVFFRNLWLFCAAGFGYATTVRQWWAKGPDRWTDLEFALLLSLPATYVSYGVQVAPYPYSLVPFLAVVCIFGARGLDCLWRLARRMVILRLTGLAVFSLILASAFLDSASLRTPTNARQIEQLKLLARITTPTDPVYDNAGSAVARPHVVFRYYTDATMRRVLAEELTREIPVAILNAGCVVRINDTRSRLLPRTLRTFLAESFLPYSGSLHLWGREYAAGDGCLNSVFAAPRTASYFVDPPEVLSFGSLSIDGVGLSSTELSLTRGLHTVSWIGPPATFRILWLPADGVRWTPRPGIPALGAKIF